MRTVVPGAEHRSAGLTFQWHRESRRLGCGHGDFYGAIVAKTVTSNGHMDFHYDETLSINAKTLAVTMWRQLQTASERAIYAAQLSF